MVRTDERTRKTRTVRRTRVGRDAAIRVAEREPHRILDRAGFQIAMGAVPSTEDERPPEEIVRGRCPECGEALVSNLYWQKERGYLLRYECWEGLMPQGRCRFYAVP
jgi:hypothetical protein